MHCFVNTWGYVHGERAEICNFTNSEAVEQLLFPFFLFLFSFIKLLTPERGLFSGGAKAHTVEL